MKIVIFNGNPAPENREFDLYLDGLVSKLKSSNHGVTRFDIREMEIRYCIGCWNCWVKTPGECVFRDDMYKIYPEMVEADWLILASPLVMGFVSAIFKKATERLIPLLLPYVDIVQGECHHYKRYEKTPALGLLLQPEHDTDAEDIRITTEIHERLALNFRTELHFCRMITTPVEEVCHEIGGI